MKCWARWITSWNQDCQEKYQQPQISDDTTVNARKWRGTKEILDKGKEESDKAGLKLIIQKTKIMAYGPTISQQLGGEKNESSDGFSFLVLQNHCRW